MRRPEPAAPTIHPRAPRLRTVTVPKPAPGWLAAFAADPKAGIAKAVRAFAGEPT